MENEIFDLEDYRISTMYSTAPKDSIIEAPDKLRLKFINLGMTVEFDKPVMAYKEIRKRLAQAHYEFI